MANTRQDNPKPLPGLIVPAALNVQKKRRRFMTGRIRPIRCPECKMFTRQVATDVGTKGIKIMGQWMVVPHIKQRMCEGCGTVFTRLESRRSKR